MGKYGKWIGGGLGFVLGGPIGAIVGAVVGSMFDGITDKDGKARSLGSTTSGDFEMSFLVLSAAVINADGKIMKSELNYVKSYLHKQFGADRSAQMMLMLRDILQKDIPLRQVCLQISAHMPHAMRLQLLHYLFGIAMSDGRVDISETNVIGTIANYLRISVKDFESIKAMFVKDTESAYKILEIEKNCTESELKKAYRKMAIKYHPDKVAQLGDAHIAAAKEKFLKVQDAYDKIKKERGIP